MEPTRKKLAVFFDQDDDDTVSQKPLDNQKLNQFAQGTVRKSRREKEQEAAEARRREEEERAARAYAEFVDAFEGDGAKPKAGGGFVRAGAETGVAYAPQQSKPAREATSRTSAMFERDDEEVPISAPKKGKRAMDAFLDEIKRDQADREARFSRQGHVHGKSATAMAAYEGQSGSKDRGDPETTNLFVANLPQNVTEQSFGQFFARHGPVGSLKIMWPRNDGPAGPGTDMNMSRRSKNSGFSGFISFMKRKDAEAAMRELDGFNWGGSVLRVGWSKAVSMASKPLYGTTRSRSRSPERLRKEHSPQGRRRHSRSRSRDRRNDHRGSRRSRSRSRSPRRYHRSRSRSHDHNRRHGRSRSRSPRRRRSSSQRREAEAEDTISESFVRTVASQVQGNDAAYADNLREREKANPQYAFLTDSRHRKAKYYKSLLDRRSPVPPEFEDEGYNSVYSTDSAEESERDRGKKQELGRLARRRFAAMLRAMSGKRGEMARCMAFSLEHAEAAAEVADTIVASLLVDGTPVPRKVSRLHLICDILHNSAVQLSGAWRFRQEFQSRLGLVFDHLASIYHSFPGRITAETFKKQITSIVDIWEDWIVFPPEFTAELRARLEGSVAPAEDVQEEETVEMPVEAPKAISKFTASSFKPAEAVPTAQAEPASDGEPMDESSDSDAEATAVKKPDEDVDGAPLDDDVDGSPVDDVDGVALDDLDGAPLDDLDGEPLQNLDGEPVLDDVDGEPMDEDLDGAPVEV